MMTMPFDSGVSDVRADTGVCPYSGRFCYTSRRLFTLLTFNFALAWWSAPTVGGGHCFSISMPSPASMQRFFMLSCSVDCSPSPKSQ